MEVHKHISQFKGEYGRLPSHVELAKEMNISQRAAVTALIAFTSIPTEDLKPKRQAVSKEKDIRTSFIRAILILLSAMAVTLSIYFTALWFMGKFHWFISGLISVSMVLFMTISPSVLRYVQSIFLKTIVIFSFLVALFFSMGSTVSGQYEKLTERIEAAPSLSAISIQRRQSEEELLGMIEDAQRDKEVHQKTIEMLSMSAENRKENYREIATERKYIDSFDQRIDTLRGELKNIRVNLEQDGIIEEERDFYSFLSDLIHMKRATVEFWVSALPAIFIDVMASLCLNLALLMGRKHGDYETRKKETVGEIQN